jgi:hypothetical protein
MRQVALALIQYMNTANQLPPSEFTATGWSGMVKAIPYLAPGKLYDGHDSNSSPDSSSNKNAAEFAIPEFLCPSNPNTASVPASVVAHLDGTHGTGTNRYAMSHYAVNWGGGRGPWGREFTKTERAFRGVMRPDVAAKIRLKGIGAADITDGAASTLLLTEKRNSQGWAVGGWAGSEFDVGTSPAMNTGDKWCDMVYSGSYHPGGVNVVACDGSAHFVTAAMNRKLWYALITRDGGEPVADNGGTFILGNDKP